MARPTTKKDLIDEANKRFETLIALLGMMSTQELEGDFPFDSTTGKEAHWVRDQNVRDVLAHLYEWHELLINWVTNNQAGKTTQFLQEGYNWKTYGAMNEVLRDKHQKSTYLQIFELLSASHNKAMSLVGGFTNEQLFSKGVFTWTGGSTLGSYFVSSTASHYDWAVKKIKKYKKSIEE